MERLTLKSATAAGNKIPCVANDRRDKSQDTNTSLLCIVLNCIERLSVNKSDASKSHHTSQNLQEMAPCITSGLFSFFCMSVCVK